MITRFREGKRYCTDITKVENYEKAVNDDTQVWHLHHRLETHFSDGTLRPKNAQISLTELKALDMYWNRPPEELIFLTKSEHVSLHSKGRKHTEDQKRKIGEGCKGNKSRSGQTSSEEIRRKISEALKGRKHTEEWKRKISEAHKGKKFSEEHRRKLSESHKGKKRHHGSV